MASLPNTPFTDIDSARVAVDAPVSTDLMTDIVVDINYLKSAVDILAGITADYFLSTGVWTCPAGVTKIKAYMRGQGGGGGGGADNSFSGAPGTAGAVSYFDTTATEARGGNPGGGGGTGGAGAADLAPIIASKAIQYGSAVGPFTLQNGIAHAGFSATTRMQGFDILRSANGGIPAGPVNGNPGIDNTGQGGGGGAADTAATGGQPGAPGEYAEYIITVIPGTVYNVVVGDSPNGGAHGGGGPSGNGGKGGKGLVVVEY